jgi:hypothetical protein
VLFDLRLGMEAGARVVEVNVPARVEPRELRSAKFGERGVDRVFQLGLWTASGCFRATPPATAAAATADATLGATSRLKTLGTM